MSMVSRTNQELLLEIEELRNRLLECEDTLEAIRAGEVVAPVVSGKQAGSIWSPQSIDYSYRIMAGNMAEGTITLDNKGAIVFTNKAFSDLVGRNMATIVGTRFIDYLPSSQHVDFTTFIQKCIDRPCHSKFSLACIDGDTTPVSIAGTTFEIAGKQNICLLVNDFNERKEAAQKLRNAYEEAQQKILERTAELRESDLKYKKLFANKLNGISYCEIIVDKNDHPIDYRFLDINDAFVNITGLKKENVIGHTIKEIIPEFERSAFDFIGVHGKVALSGEETMFEQYQEILKQWYSVFVYSPQRGYFISIFSDITERKRSEEALRQNERTY